MILNVGMSMSVAATLFLLMASILFIHIYLIISSMCSPFGIISSLVFWTIIYKPGYSAGWCSVDRRHGPLVTGYCAQMRDCRCCHLDSCPNVIISWLLVLVPGLATD